MSKGAPDALRALKEAQANAQTAARTREEAAPPAPEYDGDEAACFLQLVIAAYTYGISLGLGAMPNGSAVWLRLRVPTTSTHPCAGMVAFCVSDDTLQLLQKAVAALDASPKSKWWKPDRFAATGPGGI